MPKVRTTWIFGGQSLSENKKLLTGDKPPHIIAGTPGRILHLCKDKILKLDNLKFFVLDECDKLVDKLDMRSQVQ